MKRTELETKTDLKDAERKEHKPDNEMLEAIAVWIREIINNENFSYDEKKENLKDVLECEDEMPITVTVDVKHHYGLVNFLGRHLGLDNLIKLIELKFNGDQIVKDYNFSLKKWFKDPERNNGVVTARSGKSFDLFEKELIAQLFNDVGAKEFEYIGESTVKFNSMRDFNPEEKATKRLESMKDLSLIEKVNRLFIDVEELKENIKNHIMHISNNQNMCYNSSNRLNSLENHLGKLGQILMGQAATPGPEKH